MAYNYGNQYGQSSDSMHLKSMPHASTYSVSSGLSDDYYKPVSQAPLQDSQLQNLEARDQTLKRRLRIIKFASRVLAMILSGVTIAPLAATVIKFLQTRNVYYIVDGVQRTAWANGTVTWYTYMYLGVSVVSFLVNTAIVIAYWRGVKAANRTASVTGWWSHFLIAAHIVIWIVSAAIYRYGKEPVDGKFKDLWGWTCSPAAKALQDVLVGVNFDQYCTIQVSTLQRVLFKILLTLSTSLRLFTQASRTW